LIDVEPPTVFVWLLYYLAQHYDYKRESEKALTYINEALAHSPTLVELYMVKAKILKHAGDTKQAMEVINQGRELDLQDRFINSKATKYMIRNGDFELAEKTIGLFTRVCNLYLFLFSYLTILLFFFLVFSSCVNSFRLTLYIHMYMHIYICRMIMLSNH